MKIKSDGHGGYEFTIGYCYKYTCIARNIFEAKKRFMENMEQIVDEEIDRQLRSYHKLREELG